MKIGYALAWVAITLLVIAGWRFYTGWRSGRVELTTEGEPVIVQVLAEDSDTPVGEPFDLATRAVVELPEGEYRLRVNGKGRLGRTFRFAVNRGETLAHSVSIDDGRLLGGNASVSNDAKRLGPLERLLELQSGFKPKRRALPIPFAEVAAALEFTPGRADFVGVAEKSSIRRDGRTGMVIWDVPRPARRLGKDPGPDGSPALLFGSTVVPTSVVKSAPDLNGDGTGDAVFFSASDAAVVALSGKDGSLLWNYFANEEGSGAPLGGDPLVGITQLRGVITASEPLVVDADGDGTLDVIATFGSLDLIGRRQGKRVVSAISGRSGRRLWNYAIDMTAVGPRTLPGEQPVVLVRGMRSSLVAVVRGSEWRGLDPATGELRAGPLDLGDVPVVPVQHADLDGDGDPEILALGPGTTGKRQTLSAFSIKSGRKIWSAAVDSAYNLARGPVGFPRDCTLIADLDQDGRALILVPDSGPIIRGATYRGVRLIDGRTGQTRWRRPMAPEFGEDGIAEAVVAPDLDGDGMREVMTVSMWNVENRRAIFVDALSGKDGHALWWWKVDTQNKLSQITAPVWWGHGPDGWPLLSLPLGEDNPDPFTNVFRKDAAARPIVHLLEASTGRERHTLIGLSSPRLADLDGDGLTDIWGEVDGDLHAIRGEAPEAWRALGHFEPAGSSHTTEDIFAKARRALGQFESAGSSNERAVRVAKEGADFDGDGIADTLIGGVQAPEIREPEMPGSHTAMVRSGRDGHVIWKVIVDPLQTWLAPTGGNAYSLSAFPLPAGDFDGDGTPDVVVARTTTGFGAVALRRRATLPIELFSGRTGARLWSAGTLPLHSRPGPVADVDWTEARVVEAHGRPDLIIRHGGNTGLDLARVSGRDGRVVWETVIPDLLDVVLDDGKPVRLLDDSAGESEFDVLLLCPQGGGMSANRTNPTDYTLLAVSLRDGKRLWSRAVRSDWGYECLVRAGDLDGDKQPEVAVMALRSKRRNINLELEVQVLDVRDGTVKWTWNAGDQFSANGPIQRMTLANFGGNGARDVCVSFMLQGGARRIVVLSGDGKERVRRELAKGETCELEATDLDGDGRDELVVQDEGTLSVWNRDLKDVWSSPTRGGSARLLVSSSRGVPGAVIIPPALGLDGATGKPRWIGGGSPIEPASPGPRRMLDPGNASRLPRFIENRSQTTICRVALPANPQGSIPAPSGKLVRARRVDDDPRWARPLPWVKRLTGALSPRYFFASGGLALVNVILPLAIVLWARGRRRFWHIRALMVLPLAAAIPLMTYLTLAPWMPSHLNALLSSEARILLVATLAGLPFVYYVAVMGASVVRRRGRALIALVGVTVLTAVVVAAGWTWLDRKSMAGMEHYEWEGWELVMLPGAYMAAVLWAAGNVVLVGSRRVRRRPL